MPFGIAPPGGMGCGGGAGLQTRPSFQYYPHLNWGFGRWDKCTLWVCRASTWIVYSKGRQNLTTDFEYLSTTKILYTVLPTPGLTVSGKKLSTNSCLKVTLSATKTQLKGSSLLLIKNQLAISITSQEYQLFSAEKLDPVFKYIKWYPHKLPRPRYGIALAKLPYGPSVIIANVYGRTSGCEDSKASLFNKLN